jgi:hypothetical protein
MSSSTSTLLVTRSTSGDKEPSDGKYPWSKSATASTGPPDPLTLFHVIKKVFGLESSTKSATASTGPPDPLTREQIQEHSLDGTPLRPPDPLTREQIQDCIFIFRLHFASRSDRHCPGHLLVGKTFSRPRVGLVAQSYA